MGYVRAIKLLKSITKVRMPSLPSNRPGGIPRAALLSNYAAPVFIWLPERAGYFINVFY